MQTPDTDLLDIDPFDLVADEPEPTTRREPQRRPSRIW